MKDIKQYCKENKGFCIAVGLLMLMTAATLLAFNFKGHDYSFHIQRIASIAEEIRIKGFAAFPIRIYSTNLSGYGYANPMFYGDIFLYPFALLMLFGINGVYVFRIMNLCLYIFCFLSTYWCLKQTVKDTESSAIGAVLYTFSAYFAVDVFVRNAVGESFAYAFLPFIAYGFYCTMINREMPKKHRLFLALGMSGLILTHIISTLLVTMTLVVVVIVYYKKWTKDFRIVKDFICLALVTVGICAFFAFPLLEQMICSKFLVTAEPAFNFAARPMHIASWIAPHAFWKLQGDRFQGAVNAAWFPGGFGFILITLLMTWAINADKLKKKAPAVSLVVSLFLILFAHGVVPLEKVKGLFEFMQFPFRILLLATLFMSIFGVYAVYELKSKAFNWVLIAMCAVSCVIVMGSGYKIIQKEIPNMKDEYTLTTDALGNAEYIPEEMVNACSDKNFSKYTSGRGYRIVASGDALITRQLNDGSGLVEFDFLENESQDLKFELPLVFYKGYSAKDIKTGARYETTVSENGLVSVNVGNVASGSVRVSYTGTAVQHISDIISVLTLLGFLVYFINPYMKKLLKNK